MNVREEAKRYQYTFFARPGAATKQGAVYIDASMARARRAVAEDLVEELSAGQWFAIRIVEERPDPVNPDPAEMYGKDPYGEMQYLVRAEVRAIGPTTPGAFLGPDDAQLAMNILREKALDLRQYNPEWREDAPEPEAERRRLLELAGRIEEQLINSRREQ